jgi:hypothetical protein
VLQEGRLAMLKSQKFFVFCADVFSAFHFLLTNPSAKPLTNCPVMLRPVKLAALRSHG